jgi:hypothetical protein
MQIKQSARLECICGIGLTLQKNAEGIFESWSLRKTPIECPEFSKKAAREQILLRLPQSTEESFRRELFFAESNL